MARTEAGNRLTAAYRAQQLANRAGSIRDLTLLWKAVDPTNLRDTIDVFSQAAAILMDRGYDQSAADGANYFTLFRRVEGARGPAPTVALAARAPLVETRGLLRGSALIGIIAARRAGMSVQESSDKGLVRVIGTFAKLMLAGGNRTVLGAVQRDRAALGWARVTSSDDPCAFCRLLSSRGPVYQSEASADFETHDFCACTAEPVYDGTGLDQSKEHLQEYRDAQAWARSTGNLSTDTSNNALNNYRRWLAAGKPTP